MTREEAIKMVQAHKFPKPTEEWQRVNNEAIDMAIESLSADTVLKGVLEQFRWERDVAMMQLEEYGIPFFTNKDEDIVKVVRCKDCRFAEKGTDLSAEETDEGTPRHYIDWIKCHNYDIHKGSMRYVGDDDYCSWGERKEPCRSD